MSNGSGDSDRGERVTSTLVDRWESDGAVVDVEESISTRALSFSSVASAAAGVGGCSGVMTGVPSPVWLCEAIVVCVLIVVVGIGVCGDERGGR